MSEIDRIETQPQKIKVKAEFGSDVLRPDLQPLSVEGLLVGWGLAKDRPIRLGQCRMLKNQKVSLHVVRPASFGIGRFS